MDLESAKLIAESIVEAGQYIAVSIVISGLICK